MWVDQGEFQEVDFEIISLLEENGVFINKYDYSGDKIAWKIGIVRKVSYSITIYISRILQAIT